MNAIVSELNVYPVKSLGGIKLQESLVTPRGLEHDRRWMVVGEDGVFFTQRDLPAMATVGTAVGENGLLITKGGESMRVRLPESPGSEAARVKVEVWNDEVDAMDAGDPAAEFLSAALYEKCRLVYMADQFWRPVNPRFGDHPVSFADAYPVLAASTSSLDALNEKLEQPVPMERFRPNIVISGLEAFEEDNWKEMRIGGVTFLSAKPCARCVVTTIDQRKGEKTGKEPLRTLAGFRRAADAIPDRYEELGLGPNDALFGQNLIPLEAGNLIRVGDKVEVISRF